MSNSDRLKKIKRMKGEGLIQFLDKFTQEAEYYDDLKEADEIKVLLPKVPSPAQGIVTILDANCGLYDILEAFYRFDY